MQTKQTLRCAFAAVIGLFAANAGPASAGTLAGKISSAKKATPAKIAVTTDQAICGKKDLYDPSLITAKDGGVANVVVSVEGVKGGTAPAKTVIISQNGCEYVPHVATAGVGSKVRLVNGDSTLHNVHGYLEEDTMFNFAMPVKGQKSDKNLDEPGIVKLKCDVHNWMSSYIHVFDHEYHTVTGADGSFSIPNVPAGSYKVTVWHEKLGSKTQRVTVSDGDTAFNFSF